MNPYDPYQFLLQQTLFYSLNLSKSIRFLSWMTSDDKLQYQFIIYTRNPLPSAATARTPNKTFRPSGKTSASDGLRGQI